MQGDEIAKVLVAACEKTGLPREITGHLMLNFAIVWGEQILADMDRAVFSDMVAGMEASDAD